MIDQIRNTQISGKERCFFTLSPGGNTHEVKLFVSELYKATVNDGKTGMSFTGEGIESLKYSGTYLVFIPKYAS